MKVLQIANDFCGSKVHSNLFSNLDNLGVNQVIYCPVRSQVLIGRNVFTGKKTEIHTPFIIKSYHKLLYHVKQKHLYNELIRKIDLSDVDICHAATLFSDGAIAYDIYKNYGIPYIVAVRSTDINLFMRYMPHTWYDGIKILLNAQKIVFISKALMEQFNTHFIIKTIKNKIENKYMLIPNGIDDIFLDNVHHRSHNNKSIVYVGLFSSRKNVLRLVQAVLELQKEKGFEDIKLFLIGGGGNRRTKVQKLVDSNPDTLQNLGPIYDKTALCKLFNNCSLFAMPSIHETFGLVYIEALTQNLPLIYTKGQGIDGLFRRNVGIAVNPYSVSSIKDAIKEIFLHRTEYYNNNVPFDYFRWSNIAISYNELYKLVLNNDNIDLSLIREFGCSNCD